MIKAAVHAYENCCCVVIAHSNRLLKTLELIDYVVDGLNATMDLGAYMSMAYGQKIRKNLDYWGMGKGIQNVSGSEHS